MNNIAPQHKNPADPKQESEEITLYSSVPDELDEPQSDIESHTATLKFAQLDKKRSIGKKLVLYDNKQLSVADYNLKYKRQFWLNLAFVHPKAQAKWNIAWTWLGFSLLFSALTAGAVTLIQQPLFGIDRWTAVGVSLLFLGLCVLCVFTLVRKSNHVLNFYSLNGKIQVMQLLYNNPTRELFNQASKTLLEKIDAAQRAQHLARNEALAAELAMHRQLMQNNIINAEDYEIAKSRLFSMHNK